MASAADAQKNRAAEGLGGIADVARQTGEELRGQNETLASWVNAASDQLRHMADRLRDRPAAELAEDLTRFARERPAVFIGGAFLLGLGVARLLKSSPHRAWQGRLRRAAHRRSATRNSAMRPTGEARPGGPGAPTAGRMTPSEVAMSMPMPERSVAELFTDLSQQLSTLFRQEALLARTEVHPAPAGARARTPRSSAWARHWDWRRSWRPRPRSSCCSSS